jgi:hypothetical protein
VRLRSPGGQRVEGRFIRYVPYPPAFQVTSEDSPASFTMLDSLWVRGNAANGGTIIGALVGGIPSAAVFSVGAAIERRSLAYVVAGTAAGALAGALVGRAIGMAFPRWRLRYVRTSDGRGAWSPNQVHSGAFPHGQRQSSGPHRPATAPPDSCIHYG